MAIVPRPEMVLRWDVITVGIRVTTMVAFSEGRPNTTVQNARPIFALFHVSNSIMKLWRGKKECKDRSEKITIKFVFRNRKYNANNTLKLDDYIHMLCTQ